MSETLGLMIDILVLASLGMTIFFALRLSKSLNSFRQYKDEFSVLMRTLSGHIEKAYEAIDELKDASAHHGGDLQKSVNDARYLLDELDQVNQAGNALATRLENLAEQTRRGAEQPFTATHDLDKPSREPDIMKGDPPSFFIQDRDYDDDEDVTSLQSQAEQDLMAALKKSGKAGGRS